MLTADLVNARRLKGELKITPLDARSRERAAELAHLYVDLARDHIGRTRDELEEAWSAIEVSPRERRLADGLQKLIDDRCEWGADERIEPEALRREVFLRAAELRRTLPHGTQFDRVSAIESIASANGLTVDALERALFADLRGAHLLQGVRPLAPSVLAAEYDLAQAQAVLLRAVRVVVEVGSQRPGGYRALFHKLKFLRLLHTIERLDDDRFRIVIDGPFSLFESVTKYGLQLALALPAIAACDEWRLEADVRWGKEREPLRFLLDGKRFARGDDALDATAETDPARLADDVQALLEGLRAAAEGTPWRIKPSTEILDLPGVGQCVPDLQFDHARTKRRVHLEVLGYWSRPAVWRRVELMERGLPARILFAVGQHLRVSEEALDETASGALYVYKRTMNAKAILEKVEALAARPEPPKPRRSKPSAA